MRALAFALTLLLAGPATAEPVTLRFGERTAAVETLPAEGRETVTLTAHGRTHAYKGVPLHTLLARVGAPAGEALRGPALRNVVIVTGRDGYAAVLALAEVDPALGGRRVILADREDGHPLDTDTGPLRLVVEGDRRPARSVRQVVSVEVRTLTP